MLTDEKFCEAAMKFSLFGNTEDKKYTFDEYKQLIEANQTDKDGNLIYLYTTDKTSQYSYIKNATDKGYDVLVINDQLTSHYVGMLEQKFEKSRFVRVDSDVIDNIIVKADRKSADFSENEREMFTTLFKSQIPQVEKSEFLVSFEALSETDAPIQITQSEYMRRMKEMAVMQAGMSFYGDLPDSYSLILNVNHPVVKGIISDTKENIGSQVKPFEDSLNDLNKAISELRDKKDATDDDKTLLANKEKEAEDARKSENEIISKYAAEVPAISQLIDIALLSNNLLKGEQLDKFIKRSIDLLK